MKVNFTRVDWPFAKVFRIAYRTQTHSEAVIVELGDGQYTGRGEALGVSYHGETAATLLEQLEALRERLEEGLSRADLMRLMPAGGARNAIDSALWDLEAKRAGRRAWELAGIHSARPLTTAFTLSIDSPAGMASAAASAGQYSHLKLKLGGGADIACVQAVRRARPEATIIVDANQSWNETQLRENIRSLAELDVRLIEQPLPVGQDDALVGFQSSIPLCADESCQGSDSLATLLGKYRFINIKLDKTGGLTEALLLAREAKDKGFDLMVGCMGGSSLSMAPGFVVGQLCSVIDLDGPLLASADVPHGIRYDGSLMAVPLRELWG